jgi:hypothetical protein
MCGDKRTASATTALGHIRAAEIPALRLRFAPASSTGAGGVTDVAYLGIPAATTCGSP